MDYKNLFIQKRQNFLDAVRNPVQEQQAVLRDIIESNKNTKYAQKYNFSQIKSIEEFQKKVPITKYDNYEDYIKEILKGKKNILTSEKILLLEPTGGSTSGNKYIPYTASLKQAFNKGLEPWLSDLFLNFPDIINNPMYWSITPTLKIEKANYQIPIGFDNDLDYFNHPFLNIISKQIIIPDVKNSTEENFYDITLKELKTNKKLAFISIWNPTLLINIIKNETNPQKIWQNLKLISCWDEGNSKPYFEKLQQMLPQAYFQGKGLLATEGIMTIPIEGIGKIPCVQSHFYEFIDVKTEEIKLLNELEENKYYSIVLTTQGGLYRYRIGDIVKVYAKYKNCPLLSFVGREDNISDYFGEKLNEQFISSILQDIDIEKYSEFYMFAPYFSKNGFYYTMYYEGMLDKNNLNEFIENKLNENYHYKYARKLGQLKPFKVIKIKDGQNQYTKNCIDKGQKLGDIKPIIFSNNHNWNFEAEENEE